MSRCAHLIWNRGQHVGINASGYAPQEREANPSCSLYAIAPEVTPTRDLFIVIES